MFCKGFLNSIENKSIVFIYFLLLVLSSTPSVKHLLPRNSKLSPSQGFSRQKEEMDEDLGRVDGK